MVGFLNPLGERFRQAMDLAFRTHSEQYRKGSQTPYIAHLLAVAALIIDDGGTEDEAIAGLLHDAPEDQGGLEMLEQIRSLFGDRVAFIVDGCTDTYETPKPEWKVRKMKYLDHLRQATKEIRRVSLADKLHNATTILRDYQYFGETVWQRFNGGKDGTLWYYKELAKIFQETGSDWMSRELVRLVTKIEQLNSGDSDPSLND